MTGQAMDVDASLVVLGGFSLVQTLNFMVYASCGATAGWHLTGVSFTVGEPDGYRCSLPPNGTDVEDGGNYIAEECHLVHFDLDGGDNQSTPCVYGWDYDSTHGETSGVTDVRVFKYVRIIILNPSFP